MSNTMAVVIAENVRLHRQNEALRLSLKRMLEQQQDHIEDVLAMVKQPTPPNCGTGYCSCIECHVKKTS